MTDMSNNASMYVSLHVNKDAEFETVVRELGTNTIALCMTIDGQSVTLFFKSRDQLEEWYVNVHNAICAVPA